MAATNTRSHTMVVKFTTQIVSQKLDILLSNSVCTECLLMQSCVNDTKAKLARIQEFLFTEYRPPKTMEWLERLLRAMYYAEEFIDKFHLREARQRHEALHKAAWPLATLVSKYKLGRDLSILVNKMDELCNDQYLKVEAEGKSKKKPASSSSYASAPWQGKNLARLTSFWDRQAPSDFLARETEMEQIMALVQSHYYKEIPIWGDQGTGKTFLARWVYNQAKYIGYEWRAWVHLSGGKDEREFLYEILKQVDKLARDVMDMDIDEIRSTLCQKLAEKKTIIIVLDDVLPSDKPILHWFYSTVYHIARGCTITTTQDENIANYMCFGIWPMTLSKLHDFSDDESQRMLAWKLRRGSDNISEQDKEILKRCRGLPLYISLLGGLLSNAEEHERVALAKDGFTIILSDILQLSCHNLPVHLIPCFIYMALFPVAFPIPTRRLVRLWLAEGLLDTRCHDIERKRMRQAEDVGERFILELANRNVIDVVSWRADGSPKTCQMLTSLYDMIRPIAMSAGFVHIHATSKSKDGQDRDPISQHRQVLAQPRERTGIRWLAEHTNIVTDDSYLSLDLGQVRSFLSFYLRRGILTNDVNMFLRKLTSETGCSLLRVLDLEGVYKPSLDGVLHKLVLLRYLGLRSTALDLLPSAMANLYHLETLDIKHTDITLLPSSLWKARSLRHLHLNWFYIDLKNILKACSNNVNALTKLQTLSGLVVGEVNEKLMRDHMDSLTTLTTLKLYLQCSGGDASGVAGKVVADWISFRLTNLQSLTFGVIQVDKPIKEDKTKKEAKPTKEAELAKKEDKPIGLLLELSLAEQHHDLLELYLLGRLNKPIWTRLLPVSLRVLTLSGSNLETDMMPQLGGILRHLRTFRLLANSFVGTSLTFTKDGFPRLKILKIWKLPQLEKVIIEQGAMLHLQELEFRRLDKMNNIEGIRECKELENVCLMVKKGACDFVDHLWGRIGWERGYLYKREDTKTPGFSDDEEDDRDNKGETLYLHIEKEGSSDDDEDDRDDKGETLYLPVENEGCLPMDGAFMDDDFNRLLDLRSRFDWYVDNERRQSLHREFIGLLKKKLLNLLERSRQVPDYQRSNLRFLESWLYRHVDNIGLQVVDADLMDLFNIFSYLSKIRKRLYRTYWRKRGANLRTTI